MPIHIVVTKLKRELDKIRKHLSFVASTQTLSDGSVRIVYKSGAVLTKFPIPADIFEKDPMEILLNPPPFPELTERENPQQIKLPGFT